MEGDMRKKTLGAQRLDQQPFEALLNVSPARSSGSLPNLGLLLATRSTHKPIGFPGLWQPF